MSVIPIVSVSILPEKHVNMEFTLEKAIACAVEEMKMKEERKTKKVRKSSIAENISTTPIGDKCFLEVELEEGRKSPLLLSPVTNRKNSRRESVFEKNEIERNLLKESLKKYMRNKHVARYDLSL